MKRLLRASLLLGVPLLVVPLVLTRRVSAKRTSPRSAAGTASPAATRMVAREQRIQSIVDDMRQRLAIPDLVEATIVQKNKLVVSVERASDRERGFRLLLEDDFTAQLTDEELSAVVAHELGHVWIFTHHPHLHTEELANEIALRIVDRSVLSGVYDKVWAKLGERGTLTYLPSVTTSSAPPQ